MREINFNKLTLRPDQRRPECWRVYWRDVSAGTIAKRIGRYIVVHEWTWGAGFYPGSKIGEIRSGTASSYDEAKAQFTIAWLRFAHSCKPEDFKAYRDHRDGIARRNANRNAGIDRPAP